MTRVLIHCPRYPPHRGGAANYFSMLRDRVGDDIECVVLTSYHPKKKLITRSEQGDVYRVIPRISSLPRIFRFFLEVPVAALICLLLSRSLDMVHTHSTSLSVLGVVLATSLTDTPLAFDCRDEGFPKWLITRGNPVVWFSCAPTIDDRLVESGVNPQDIVRLGVINPEFVADYAPDSVIEKHSQDKLRVIYVGRLNKAKGADLAIESFLAASGKLDNAHMDIVGDGELRSELQSRVSEHESADRIEFHGEVPHPKAVSLISRSHLLLLPSESEGIPRVVLEAYEVGTAVIATEVGGIPTVLEDGKTGVFAERTSEAFAAKVEELGTDSDSRVRLATEAQKVLQERHSWQTIEDRVRKSYASAGEKHD